LDAIQPDLSPNPSPRRRGELDSPFQLTNFFLFPLKSRRGQGEVGSRSEGEELVG